MTSLPQPTRRGASPSENIPLTDITAASRNAKPKAERLTLVQRAGMKAAAVTKPAAGSAGATGSTAHVRQKSVTATVTPAQAAGLQRQRSTTRPTARPTSAAGVRPTSATGVRSASAMGNRSTGPPAATRTETAGRSEDASGPPRKVRRAAWDTKGRLEDMEEAYRGLKDQLKEVTSSAVQEKDTISTELVEARQAVADMQMQKAALQRQFEQCNEQIGRLQGEAHIAAMEREQLLHRHRMEVEEVRQGAQAEKTALQIAQVEKERGLNGQIAELEQVKRRLEDRIEDANREAARLKARGEELEADVAREKKVVATLKDQIAEQGAGAMTLQEMIRSLQQRVQSMEVEATSLKGAIASRDEALATSEQERERLHADLVSEETQRRILHNKIQELKGNIRVFCRVRPPLAHEPSETAFRQEGADEIEVTGPAVETSLSGAQDKTYGFKFDRVFSPAADNNNVFGEISQLVQSALDGYNVSIFAYGQTGSGKTHTMSSKDGMIPRAVEQIYTCAKALQAKGWAYTIEGSFLEIYNENMRDLLTKSSAKLEIRHDEKKKTTAVEGLTTVPLDSPERVIDMLDRADRNRTIAATAANERSSRSHSVFMLALEGRNEGTGERSRGVLNLIDLAGSERLSHSLATGDRLKETQHINKSLSCLADVIHALGSDAAHVPYRNSKLTYLLLHSLSGSSKTLMFVNVSPLKEHVGESLCSLRFATKVNSTIVGTAKQRKS